MTDAPWCWQLKQWPEFSYDKEQLQLLESRFQQNAGLIRGVFKHLADADRDHLAVEIMSDEALNSSEIEGEHLNRDSIRASIMRQLGLQVDMRKIPPREAGISEMIVNLYRHYSEPLKHELLHEWHSMVMNGRRDIRAIGKYRDHADPMQIVSGRIDKPRVHFEAPPSERMAEEMQQFMEWFALAHDENASILPLTRAGIAHLYFVNIHPFEDGNGRIARAIAEKSLAMSINHPSLISLSQIIQKNKRAYYGALENHNRSLQITDWLLYFGQTILDAQDHTMKLVEFIISKAKFFDIHGKHMNERQRKALLRMFQEGYSGFQGGLSADNYIKITDASASSATRDLQDMVNKKMLQRTGERKATRYWLCLPDAPDKE